MNAVKQKCNMVTVVSGLGAVPRRPVMRVSTVVKFLAFESGLGVF